MPQASSRTLRIFLKDTRHLWPEILLSLVLTAGFSATTHFTWPQFHNDFRASQALHYWTLVLMPIAWWLLIARLVHDESLVGDRQFWITRPYGWPRVLAAKLLSIALYILTPYLLAQIFLLRQAGLHPLLVLPGLGYGLALLFFLFILPLLALSSVTANTTRMFIVSFALIVYTALTAYFAATANRLVPWVPQISHPMAWVLLALPVITLVVVWLQYSSRRTSISIGLLIALVLILTAGGLVSAYLPNTTRDFPALSANESAPVTLALNTDPKLQYDIATNPNLAQTLQGRGESAWVPVLLSDSGPDRAIAFEGETYTITADGMPSRKIEWHRSAATPLFAGRMSWMAAQGRTPLTNSSPYSVSIPSWLVAEFAGKPASLHLRYAANELAAETPATVIFDGKTMDVPENGHCVQSATRNGAGVSCQYALTSPGLTHVTWTMRQACDRSDSPALSKSEWIGDSEHTPRNLDLNPIILQPTFFHDTETANDSTPVFHLCPGTPFTFTRYHVLRRRLIEATLPPVDLRQYVPPPTKAGKPRVAYNFEHE